MAMLRVAIVVMLLHAIAAACPAGTRAVQVDGPQTCAPCIPNRPCLCGSAKLTFCEKGDKRDGTFERSDDAGHLLVRGTYKHGQMTGTWTTWNVDGTKTSEGAYDAGIPVGPWLQSNGSVEWSLTYTAKPVGAKPVLDGPWELRSGTTTRGQYARGKKTGHWVESWPNQIREEGDYKDDVQIGTWITHRLDGTVEQIVEHVTADKTNVTRFRPGGIPWMKGTMEHDKQSGVWETYHPNGKVADRTTYRDGIKNGPWATFRDDGTPIEAGEYAGWATGEWTLWAADGQVEHKRHYRPRLAHASPGETVSVTVTATARAVHVQYDSEVFDEEYAFVSCPSGTTRRETKGATRIEEACETPAGVQHGPFQSWTEDSRRHLWKLLDRGQLDHGTKVGIWTENGQRVDHGAKRNP